jgi:Glutamine amidotransferase domain
MCEQYVARAETPFRLDELWDFTARLEAYGSASFGWGASWLGGDGRLHSYRDTGAFRDDPRRVAVGKETTTALLVHLRRPSKLSTIGLADTQPFDDPAGRFAFSHNGELELVQGWRARFREQGRLLGRADTEIGARWLEDAWRDDAVPSLLERLHETFGGLANMAVLTPGGEAYHYAGNRDNPVFTFRLGSAWVASTGLYSIDRSLFRFAATGATDRHLVRLRTTVTLDPTGAPRPSAPPRAEGSERSELAEAAPA